MKYSPLPFSAPMVRAVLDGSKTQTRRVAPIRELNILRHPGDMVTWSVSFLKAIKGVLGSYSGGKFSELQARSIIASQFNPYGQPGDRLWVREHWRTVAVADALPPRDLDAGYRIWYEADAPHQPGFGRFRPGMFMPRWASRITLELTDVRVERLQDISEADCIAEGIEKTASGLWSLYGQADVDGTYSPKASYRALWESINGHGSCDANPFVWVVEFRRIKP